MAFLCLKAAPNFPVFLEEIGKWMKNEKNFNIQRDSNPGHSIWKLDVESRPSCKNAVFFFSAKQVASFQVKRKCRESVLASSFANLHLQRFEKPEISPKTLATIFYSRAFFKKANEVSSECQKQYKMLETFN